MNSKLAEVAWDRERAAKKHVHQNGHLSVRRRSSKTGKLNWFFSIGGTVQAPSPGQSYQYNRCQGGKQLCKEGTLTSHVGYLIQAGSRITLSPFVNRHNFHRVLSPQLQARQLNLQLGCFQFFLLGILAIRNNGRVTHFVTNFGIPTVLFGFAPLQGKFCVIQDFRQWLHNDWATGSTCNEIESRRG